jgi:hypothetical protein
VQLLFQESDKGLLILKEKLLLEISEYTSFSPDEGSLLLFSLSLDVLFFYISTLPERR